VYRERKGREEGRERRGREGGKRGKRGYIPT
jgi:hypothetical protein